MGGKWGKESDSNGREDRQRKAGGQNNTPDIVIVSTLDLRQLPHPTRLGSVSPPPCVLFITSFRVNLEPKWPTTGCILLGLGGGGCCCGESYLPCCLS